MNIITKYFWKILTLILLIIIFLQNNFKTNDKNNVIITKPKKGNISFNKPKEIKPKNQYEYLTVKGNKIKLEHPIDTQLAEKYQKETDSLKKEILYYQSIQKRKYIQPFENKNIKGNIFANTTGTLDSIGINYEIKPDIIKIKQPVFSLLAGLSLQSNIITLKTYPGLNIGFQNKKKDIFLLGINTNQDVEVKYIKNIFTIKK